MGNLLVIVIGFIGVIVFLHLRKQAELANRLIKQYCDEQQLTPRERLELFVPICHAVQHAHQKGIIHRDIKPSNIMVTRHDGRPVPKVIDFGVAKATERQLSDKTMFTQHGQIVGTLEYMSPEQANFDQLDVDTRSDVYSLGVVLYELLAGETPFGKQKLRGAAFNEILRIIREEEPPRPSAKLSSSESLSDTAISRNIEPKKLSVLLRGELDWIVMRALEKDRVRRYESASSFAADVPAGSIRLLETEQFQGPGDLLSPLGNLEGDAEARYAAAHDHDTQRRAHRRYECTVSTTASTDAIGVRGRMPCPRLKMWPGRSCPAASTASV